MGNLFSSDRTPCGVLLGSILLGWTISSIECCGLVANKPFKVPVPGRKLMVIVEKGGRNMWYTTSFKVIYLLSKYTTVKQGKWQFFIA